MSFSGNTDNALAKSFVTQAELDDRRKRRQEEWEKVRKPEDPQDAPEEVYDNRSLYERLKEQKDAKQIEFEESHKLKNMVKGLDNEEVEFLDFIDKRKEDEERQKMLEERAVLDEYKKAVSSLALEAEEQKLNDLKRASVIVAPTNSKSNPSTNERRSTLQRQNALGIVVKRKSSESASDDANKKAKADSPPQVTRDSAPESIRPSIIQDRKPTCIVIPEAMRCIAILPSVVINGATDDSSSDSSDCSADVHEGCSSVLGSACREAH